MDKQGSFAGAANLLKPELARGAVTIIGATTLDEYRKHIEKDEAFARRFELLQVEEPDTATAFRMMKTVMPLYQQHHRIEISDETLQEAVRLAKRYIKDRRLPDAAIDLTDRSMAALRLIADTGTDLLQVFQQAYAALKEQQEVDAGDYQWHYCQLKSSVSPVVWSNLEEDQGPPPQDTAGWQQLLDSIYTRLEVLMKEGRTTLEKHDVASIVADKTGIPLGKVQAQEKERLLNMQQLLKERVVGQDHAIKVISEAVLESRSGLGKPGQPMGSFFFLGPTGTGKTELAKALAGFLFQDETNIIRFDMSEFKEEHSAALLYGAPPGYVGYEEGGLLVNKIRQQPYSVVLFDEIEKAHASVFDLFLQLMDEGKLHDKLGKEGDFSNALVLFTSNIGSKYVVERFQAGAVPENMELLEIMSRHFRPEFLGRLTEIVPFAPMTENMVACILDIQLKEVYTALEKQQIQLEITPAAHKKLALMGFTPEYGARPLGGVIRSQIRRPLSKKIISNELQAGSRAVLDCNADGELVWL
jgi:ATP-dependent Clp protease ATP-binding subunit ClpA